MTVVTLTIEGPNGTETYRRGTSTLNFGAMLRGDDAAALLLEVVGLALAAHRAEVVQHVARVRRTLAYLAPLFDTSSDHVPGEGVTESGPDIKR